jgi:hypothetical protein
MDVKLIIVSAKTGTKEISVKRPRILGRTRGIGIVIPHPMVSERHCLLFDNAGLLMVQDLNSEHGTFIGGRKVIMAPLPPGAEFSVGPLTLRAEYIYSGNLESLPKTLYDEPEGESVAQSTPTVPQDGQVPAEPSSAPPTPVVFTAPPAPLPPDTSTPAASASPQATSFFGFDGNGSFPAVAQPAELPQVSFAPSPQPVAAAPQTNAPAAAAKKPQAPIPPPLPKAVEPPRPEPVQEPDFGGFTGGYGESDGTTPEQIADAGLAIPGLDVDAMLSSPLPVQSQQPVKKKSSGSFLDYFSKRPPRRKRVVILPTDAIAPLANGNPSPPAPANPQPSAPAKPVPPPARVAAPPVPPIEPPMAINAPPPEEVDDDLSSFFKKLE